MKPILFQWNDILVPGFGFFFSLGFIVPYLLLKRQTKRGGWAPGQLDSLMIRLFLAGVLGARTLFVLEAGSYFRENPWESLCIWRGGLSFFGGLVGVLLAGFFWARSRGLRPLDLTDRFVAFGALGHFFGRLGCLSHGCCFGSPSDLPWAVMFPQVAHDGLHRHPTQAYEAILLLLLTILVLRSWWRRDPDGPAGGPTALYLMGYGAIRYTIESLRGDSASLGVLDIKLYQMVAIVCLLSGAWIRARSCAMIPSGEEGRGFMRIDCLMGTYGKASLASEALACFLAQTELSRATLLIYNQHPTPLYFDHPRVRVVNETPPPRSLRHIRQRMHELADPGAELIHWWDDDDLCLPWHLEDCLRNIAGNVAWKPASCWMSDQNRKYSIHQNTFEGSWVFRADYLKQAPVETHPGYTDHPVTMQTLESGRLGKTELGGLTSYIYRWNTGTEHVSAYGSYSDGNDDLLQARHMAIVRFRSQDVPQGGILVPADLTRRWQQYLDGIRDLVTPEEWERCRGLLEADGSRLHRTHESSDPAR